MYSSFCCSFPCRVLLCSWWWVRFMADLLPSPPSLTVRTLSKITSDPTINKFDYFFSALTTLKQNTGLLKILLLLSLWHCISFAPPGPLWPYVRYALSKHKHALVTSPQTFPHRPLDLSPCLQLWFLGKRSPHQDLLTHPLSIAPGLHIPSLPGIFSPDYPPRLHKQRARSETHIFRRKTTVLWSLSVAPVLSQSGKHGCWVQSYPHIPSSMRRQRYVVNLWDDLVVSLSASVDAILIKGPNTLAK